ncbi:MAG: hypothetical protein HUJ26_15730 [Planctomycetaceae bacterium]|nr:hypothetical protein [Planctomycetaceae bacterium]
MVCLLVVIGGTFQLSAAELEITSFGWDGHFQPGRWTPIRVQVADSESSEFDVTAKDADGNLVTLRQMGFPTGTPNEFELRVKLGRIDGDVKVELIEADQSVATAVHRTFTAEQMDSAIRLNARMLGILSDNTEWANTLADEVSALELPGQKTIHCSTLDSGTALPVNPVNWESLDVLFLGIDSSLPEPQAAALQSWVKQGGHLLLSVGTAVDAYDNSSLADWLPVTFGKDLRLRDLSQFESFIGRSSRIDFTGRVEATEIATYLGENLIDSLDGPLVVSMTYGFGHLTVSGVALDRPPLAGWNSLDRLVQQLAFPERRNNDQESESQNQLLTDSGISELATQLNLSQQNFPEVQRSSIWVIIGAILVYLVLIGPLDYFLVYRVFKRPEMTWLTFPILILGMAVVSVWAGLNTNSMETTINQIDVLDVDGTQNLAHLKSWMTGYSPSSQRVAIDAEVNLPEETQPDSPARLSWDSVPEDGFGGLYRQSGFESLSSTNYHINARESRVEDFPVAQWSTATLTVDQSFEQAPFVRSDLKGSTLGSVSGIVEHRFPGKLTEWMLVYRNRVYFPRPTRRNDEGITIPPNQPIELTRSDLSVSRDLKGFLTGTRQIRIRSKNPTEQTRIVVEQEDYDLFSTDPKMILRMLSFHDAAGGSRYTNLENSALDQLDWTRYLDSRHAVLYGVLKSEERSNLVTWTWNGETVRHDRQTTVVRCLLPVEVQNDARRELPDLDEILKNKNK